MPAPSPVPGFVYKILDEAPPQPLPPALPLSDLDARDGYIHLSTAQQVPGTCSRFFAGVQRLWLLKLPLDPLQEYVRWEEAADSSFPHLYGRGLGQQEVEAVGSFERQPDETWQTALRGDFLE